MSGWSDIQSVDEINVGRFFEYDTYAIMMFKRWMPFLAEGSPDVLEVGSGSGYFTQILLQINPDIRLTCLEPDMEFVAELKKRFADRITVIGKPIEKTDIEKESFDLAIAHIVLHNIPEVSTALGEMMRVVRRGGHVVAIEPLQGSNDRYPDSKVGKAIDFLFQVNILRWERRKERLDLPDTWDAWNRCYALIFDDAGLKNVHSYGWASVFTLSDSRYDIDDRRKWIRMRRNLFLVERGRITDELQTLGKNLGDIEDAFNTVLGYFDRLIDAPEEEFNHIHEQHITNRVITIGERR